MSEAGSVVTKTTCTCSATSAGSSPRSATATSAIVVGHTSGQFGVAEEQQRRAARPWRPEVVGRARGVGERERRAGGRARRGRARRTGRRRPRPWPAPAEWSCPRRRPRRPRPAAAGKREGGRDQQGRQRRARRRADGGTHEDTVRRCARQPRTRRRSPTSSARIATNSASRPAGDRPSSCECVGRRVGRRRRRRAAAAGRRRQRSAPARGARAPAWPVDGRLDPGGLATVAVALHAGKASCRPPGTGRRRARTPGTRPARCRRRASARNSTTET